LDLGLENKAFVVGGASRGLGRAVAEQLVAEGARVLLVARDGDAVSRVADELGEGASPLAADLAEPEGIVAVADAVGGAFGGLDGVLINAGGPPPGAALDDDERWELAFRLLLGGPLGLLRALVKCLAQELGPMVRVNRLAPGRFDTDRVRSLDASRAEAKGISVEQQREETSKTIPLGRYGKPAELGRVAAFCCLRRPRTSTVRPCNTTAAW